MTQAAVLSSRVSLDNDVTMVTEETVGRPVTITVLFVDLVGSTARQARLGDDANDEFRRRFTRSLEDVIARHEGSVVKGTGDGMMVAFRRSSTDSLACANEMHDVVEALDPDESAQIYVGISAGDAIEEDGDFFGQPVNVAARLCAPPDPARPWSTKSSRPSSTPVRGSGSEGSSPSASRDSPTRSRAANCSATERGRRIPGGR